MSATADKKPKTEKSSKKRKADELDDHPATISKSVKAKPSTNSTQADISRDASPPSNPPAKRKASVSEIEVDISLPEPPSRKDLRRLKKGKPLPPKASSPEPSSKPQKPEVEKRSEHGIWIGNLSYSTSKSDLLTFITSNSSIQESAVTRIHMPGQADQKSAGKVSASKQHNTGFAYVDFSTPEAVMEVLQLSESLLAGRRVLIKDNKSFEGRPEKKAIETKPGGKPPNKRVFVGNLRFDTTKESLREHFERCGPIDDVFIATFEDSGKCKGYGWITFAELEGAISAVKGWVLVPQDTNDDNSGLEEKSEDGAEDTGKDSKPRMRQWWVNRIHREPVRLEFAEDAQVRYQKRYGKDGGKLKSGQDREGALTAGAAEHANPEVARLTGTILKSQGKKVVF